jgi:hypothetical protein
MRPTPLLFKYLCPLNGEFVRYESDASHLVHGWMVHPAGFRVHGNAGRDERSREELASMVEGEPWRRRVLPGRERRS